ncbi:MAG: cytochrome c3 family protein [Syntrophorhabdus sp.]
MAFFGCYQFTVLLFIFFLFLPSSTLGAISSDECLGCHDTFKDFFHGGTTCQDCHKDIVSLPHEEKLKKPSCNACHEGAAKLHAAGIHKIAKVECKSCHNAHMVDKGRKSCTDCHKKVPHRLLPSKEKHLEKLECHACHGTAKKSTVRLELQVSDRALISKESIDLDKNNKIDMSEWDNLQAILQKKAKKYSLNRVYTTDTDVHGVMKKPHACKTCHIDRQLFHQARLHVSGAVKFEIPVDPSIFIPEIPSIESYGQTVHGRKGVRCSDCHESQKSIDDSVCINCHKDVHGIYKNTVHAQKGATHCTDCHNPHRIEAYKELEAKERVAVCSRCHKDYIQTHTWLPNTILHFNYLECSTCHSPESAKSMVFYLSTRKGDKKEIVSYKTLESFYGKNVLMTPLLDKNGNEIVDSQELRDFFIDVKKQLADNAFIGSSIVVTRVHHDYSVKRQKERICTTCHSDKAPFYESMFFVLPENGYHVYIPVIGTILSSIPVSFFLDISLLGEQKATWSDIKGFFALKPGELAQYSKELGFKWIDILGIGLGLVILFFVLIHLFTRLLTKK